MSKCGKGCMPECEYFTTGGCISPFNCPYKIETGYINSATSIPTYMGQYNGMSDDDIELCLERLSTCKATDVMNFDYSGTLAYIKRLKSENAELRERLEKAVELPCELGSHLFTIEKRYEFITYGAVQYSVENIYCAGEIVVCEDGLFRFYTPTYHPRCLVFGKDIFTTREAAEARLAELKGGKER